jgi:cell wall-associated NlpC family hydrolase
MNVRIVVWVMLVVWLAQSCKSSRLQQAKREPYTHSEHRRLKHFNTKFELTLDQTANLALYELIEEWLGVPHKDNGCEKSGTDCSCFVKMVYKTIYNTDAGKHSQEMYARTQRIEKSQLQEGDLVFFKTKGDKISHVGIYLNNQKFVHVSTRKGVAVNSLTEVYFQKTYAAAGRRP